MHSVCSRPSLGNWIVWDSLKNSGFVAFSISLCVSLTSFWNNPDRYIRVCFLVIMARCNKLYVYFNVLALLSSQKQPWTCCHFFSKEENSMLLRNMTLLCFWYYKIPRFPSCIVFIYFGKYFALSDTVCGPELALPDMLVSWDSKLKSKNLLCDFLGAVSRTRGWKG